MLITDSNPQGLVALTGPPNSGKTSAINRLKLLGFPTIHEVPAELIAEGFSPLVNWELFDWKRWGRQIRYEEALPAYRDGRGEAYCDRTLLDMVGYNRATGRPIPHYIHRVQWPRYRLFFMMPAQRWQENGLRYEADGDQEKAREFQEFVAPFIWEGYTDFGAKGYKVPDASTNDQVEFILDVVRHERELLAA